jgi:hypothetical protein
MAGVCTHGPAVHVELLNWFVAANGASMRHHSSMTACVTSQLLLHLVQAAYAA